MLSALLDRASDNPKLRRPFMLLWRRAWRLRRATLAKAVLVVRNDAGRVRSQCRPPLLSIFISILENFSFLSVNLGNASGNILQISALGQAHLEEAPQRLK
jgi:hypothetical protein